MLKKKNIDSILNIYDFNTDCDSCKYYGKCDSTKLIGAKKTLWEACQILKTYGPTYGPQSIRHIHKKIEFPIRKF